MKNVLDTFQEGWEKNFLSLRQYIKDYVLFLSVSLMVW